MATTTLVPGVSAGTALTVLADGTIVAARAKVLQRIDPATGVSEHASLPAAAAGMCTHPNGTDVIVALPAVGLVRASFGGGAVVAPLVSLAFVRDVAVIPASGDLLAVVGRTPSRLVRMAADGTGATTLAASLGRPVAVAVDDAGTTAFVIEAGVPRRLVSIDLATGARTVVPAAIGRSRDVELLAPGTGDHRLVLADPDGDLLVVDPVTGSVSTIVSGPIPVWAVATMGGPATVLAGIGNEIDVVDVSPPPAVEIHPPSPIYLSSWATISITVRAPVSVDDILLVVDPPHGGLVSNSRAADFDPANPTWLVSVGNVVGEYTLVALHSTTGDTLAKQQFSITDTWVGPDGPPLAYVGTLSNMPPDPAWGGGDPFVPQNINVHPAIGTRNIAVVIAETTDVTALNAAGQQAIRTLWQNEVFDGVMRNGVSESAARYWSDVSNGALTLANAGVVGPIRLSNAWASYVPAASIDATGKGGGVGEFGQPVVAAIRAQNEANARAGQPPLLDLATVDSIVLVVRSVPATATPAFPGRYTWPASTRPGGYQLDFEIGREEITAPFPFGQVSFSVPINRRIQMFTMPSDWTARQARENGEVVSHELGHTLGLLDAYARDEHSADIKKRDVGTDMAGNSGDGTSWSLMSFEGEFAQLTIAEKMLLGFVRPEHIRNLSFATLGPVDETITLHATDLGTPPPGRFSGVEVRIRDGQNYYFEYRRETPTEPSEQDLPVDRTVFATDVISGDKEPADRRMVIRLRDDADADRAEFQTGDDYEETDTSSPKYPNDFVMDVIQTQADSAQIRIRYGDAKPDPQIRPWAQSTNWKSPDLVVVNARNQAESRFRDIPWEGHDNRIVATVRNPGKVNATAVRVDFFVKDFTLGDGAESPLGSATHDVASGATVEFRSDAWVPPPLSLLPPIFVFKPHYCVVARIAEYKDPVNPAIREITLDNNEAQSNHTQLISISASPSSREAGVVKVVNPLDRPAVCQVQVRQSSPLARTYVDHAWVQLEAGESRDVLFMTESVVGDPSLSSYTERFGKHFAYELPNSVRLTGIADDRETCHGLVTGGAHVLVRAARATEFVEFERKGGLVFGRIEAIDDREGADGKVLVTIGRPGDDPEREVVREGVAQNGDFRVEVGEVEPGLIIQGHYLGRFDLAPCESKPIDAV